MPEFITAYKVLEVRIFSDFFYKLTVRNTLSFLDNESSKCHSERLSRPPGVGWKLL